LTVVSGTPTGDQPDRTAGDFAALDALLPEYRIERELGRGAMGVVYLARHRSLDRLVAVKELQGSLAADRATRDRFSVEARVLATLNHPHVVPVYDFIERDDHCVLIMEQLPGGTVWDQFVATGLTMPQATAITLATCSAMQHAHDQQVLHRDIKPENLMFDADGVLKVTDFGIARMVNGTSTKATIAGSVLGTPAYMAPEQAEGNHVGPPADVYATATMYYEMLSGRLPFDRADSLVAMLTQRITSEPLPLRDVAPRVPTQLAEVTMRGLARSTSERFGQAEEFGTRLAEAAVDAWGPGWLDASGLVVRGSERIGRAARTLRPDEARRPEMPTTDGARSTVVRGSTTTADGAVDGASSTVIGSPADRDHDHRDRDGRDRDGRAAGESSPQPHDQQPEPTPPEASTDPTPATPSPQPPLSDAPVKPLPSDRDVGRAKAADVDRLIDISEVLAAPSRPIAQYAIAAALFVAGLVWALVGGGTEEPESTGSGALAAILVEGTPVANLDDPIELDLSDTITVDRVLPGLRVSMAFTQLGVAVGSTDSIDVQAGEAVELDPGFLGNVTSGALTASIDLTDTATGAALGSSTFAVTATNPWFLTAAGVISILLALFAVAGIESNLRAFRRGRNGVTSFVGLALTGALFGAAASAGLTIIAGTARGQAAVIGPAALCGIGAIALGLAARANRRRRRAAKQALRHTAIKALASR
jgi:serine/threonine protein kinase